MAARKNTSRSGDTVVANAPPDARSPQAPSLKPQATYTVLARRYRSRDFEELIGQEPIARTLRNAIASGRTAHAYLFCGTRGVGKTSLARIFARALNATGDLAQQEEIAAAILRGDDLDVIEIDAASNRGIDNARELIANAGISPARSPYKIYIIDEVHMLTREAFNALLKTMEEPPAHVKFILCTTEPHKVPATIQSRCQRFDFRAIPTARIIEQLRRILEAEGIAADDEAVAHVARLGQGSMRDALSIMDRLLSTGERRITMDLLEQTLGLPDQTVIGRVVDAVIASDARAALDAGAELLARGSSVEQAMEVLIEHLRNLMIVASCGADSELLELGAEARRAAMEQAKHFDPPALVHMIALCESVARHAKGSAAGRALFEAALVRLTMSAHLASIPALLSGATEAPAQPPASNEKKKSDDPRRVADVATVTPRPPSPTIPQSSLLEVKRLAEANIAAPAAPQTDASSASAPSGQVADDALWDAVLAAAARSAAVQARVQNLVFESFDGRVLRLSVSDEDPRLATYLASQTGSIAALVERVTSRKVVVELIADAAASSASTIVPEAELEAARRSPLIQRAMELFDATVIGVDRVSPGNDQESTHV